nr:MAG TPA: hypothetical protein [Caudoviricetes sp.]
MINFYFSTSDFPYKARRPAKASFPAIPYSSYL